MDTKGEFIDAEIQVERVPPGPPLAFRLGDQGFRVVQVLSFEQRIDRRSPWWLRRHRDHYVVRTGEGRTFELYHHRGPGRPYWVLYRELGGGLPTP